MYSNLWRLLQVRVSVDLNGPSSPQWKKSCDIWVVLCWVYMSVTCLKFSHHNCSCWSSDKTPWFCSLWYPPLMDRNTCNAPFQPRVCSWARNQQTISLVFFPCHTRQGRSIVLLQIRRLRMWRTVVWFGIQAVDNDDWREKGMLLVFVTMIHHSSFITIHARNHLYHLSFWKDLSMVSLTVCLC